MHRFLPLIFLLLAACSREVIEAPSDEDKIQQVLAENASNPWDEHLDTAPDNGCIKLKINNIGPLRKVFNDSNHVHLVAAKALGINPINSESDILNLKRPIVRIASCKQYFVDKLTHSFPYLVPEAAQLLYDIGQAFNDSLAVRGGGQYRIKVTSVLRTPLTVKKLKRINGNATEESTHQFGTTFDISYSKFICDGTDLPARTFEDLKNLLAEVLFDMRRQGRCFVKYEVKQSCFHITARPSNLNNYKSAL